MTKRSRANVRRTASLSDSFEEVSRSPIALAPPGVENPTYSSFRRTRYEFTPADRPMDLLSFIEWQGHPDRRAIRLEEDDRAALGQIIALLSRPQRPEVGLSYPGIFQLARAQGDRRSTSEFRRQTEEEVFRGNAQLSEPRSLLSARLTCGERTRSRMDRVRKSDAVRHPPGVCRAKRIQSFITPRRHACPAVRRAKEALVRLHSGRPPSDDDAERTNRCRR